MWAYWIAEKKVDFDGFLVNQRPLAEFDDIYDLWPSVMFLTEAAAREVIPLQTDG